MPSDKYTIKYTFNDGTSSEVEVSKKFYDKYFALEKKAALIDRKETRRHQSLDKSLENGWDILDHSVNVELEAELNETLEKIHKALECLTQKQRFVFVSLVFDGYSVSEVAKITGVSRQMVRHHYIAAVIKIKKVLPNTLSNSFSRGY